MVIAVVALLAPTSATGQTPPDDPFLGVPILTGGAPAPGGVVTYENNGTIVRTGSGVHGISASSTTGGYPAATLDRIRTFTDASFSYVTSAVRNPDATIGTLGTAVAGILVDEDGMPLRDESGDVRLAGSFTLNADGTYAFEPGAEFQALVDGLQPGESVRTAVRFEVTGTNNVLGTQKVSDGLLVASASRDEEGTLTQGIGADYADFGSSSRPERAGDNTVFPDLKAYVTSLLQFSYRGGVGSAVGVTNNGTITTSGTGAYGIYVNTVGQTGSNGRDAGLFRSSRQGGAGGAGGAITITANGTIRTCVETETGCVGYDESPGVVASSAGGNGGTGGESGWGRSASSGGPGADGANVSIFGDGTIRTGGARSPGILAQSSGGSGGAGGGGSTFRGAANGASGGAGGTVTVNGSWNIETWGNESHGIVAKSLGGAAGSGGNGGWTGTSAADGGQGTEGGAVNVFSDGTIKTHGGAAHGIYGISSGGFGGQGGDPRSIFVEYAGGGGAAGTGGTVAITNAATGWIETFGTRSHGIFAQSVGGGGGTGGYASWAFDVLGGQGGTGGHAGTVAVTNQGTILAHGAGSLGIYAQSLGGGGGDAGDADVGFKAVGGSGSGTSNGGSVSVSNTGTINTQSHAIFAESVGGGGGKGGSSSGWFSFGGSGGGGGNGADVTVSSHGILATTELNADAIFAQSLGGGGGSGGNSTSVGAFVAVSIGGSGSGGGTGGVARVGVDPASSLTDPAIDPVTGTLSTQGENADGIQVQSVGGGGGDGGFAVSAAYGAGGSAQFALGGTGGGGNNASAASAYFGDSLSSITTKGYKANGIFAQSLGGGGGSGGFSIAAAISQSFSASISIGGNGGTGGAGGAVTVGDALHPILGTITTEGGASVTVPGARGLAHGIFAQSVGGGGGSGGMSIAGGISPVSLNFAMGGKGAGGGAGSTVDVTTGATVLTKGANSHGVFAQSVGGGGGAGGFSLTVGAAAINVGVSLGGNGGAGGAGSNVTASNSGVITTMGPLSHGLFAQSVGGGGGAGGFAIAGSLTMGAGLDFALGGKGGTGGDAGLVTVANSGTITTGFVDRSAPPPPEDPNNPFHHSAIGSKGIVAQSVGGGGGSGGFAGAFSLQFNPTNYPSGTLSIGVGGNGGGAGQGQAVSVTNTGRVSTSANDSAAIFAQSAGGGGGDAGFGLAVALSASAGKSASVGVAIGGKGGSGGNGGAVTVTNTQSITTTGNRSEGIFAQSVGGGGGNGGAAISIAAALSKSASYGASVAVGGDGAGGGIGQHVTVTNEGSIETSGDYSIGIRAQSLGGGGGNGGMSVSGTAEGPPAWALGVAVGGGGGSGGTAGQVDVFGTAESWIKTHGAYSPGIEAQSLGGGGGNGGLAAAVALNADSKTTSSFVVTTAVGGGGGSGNIGGIVNLGTSSNHLRSSIVTEGDDSSGIFAHSVGGGGGIGALSFAGSLSLMPKATEKVLDVNASISVGGSGGSGNDSGVVNVYHDGLIDTSGDDSHGIFAQSNGGGGGSAGSARSVSLQLGKQKIPVVGDGGKAWNVALDLSFGGRGGAGGAGNLVNVHHTGDIFTRGADAYGIFAQSLGGGGGAGGNAHVGFPYSEVTIPFSYSTLYTSGNFVMGGSGGASGNGGDVVVMNSGAIETSGAGSGGVFAQSVGGGGGAGGSGVLGISPRVFSAALGGGVGTTGNGGLVSVTVDGSITTHGDDAAGIFAESVGGGGGKAGGVERGLNKLPGVELNWNIGWGPAFGQDAGTAGNGGDVTVDSTADISTSGSGSIGILAHSIGGGGGVLGTIGMGSPYLGNFAGSTGGFGSGGRVVVNQTGSIVTDGEGADGIFAQSAGGAKCDDPSLPCWNLLAAHPEYVGLGGAVSVTLNAGSIFALGSDSDGIFAQSLGQAGSGNITIDVLDAQSLVVGGAGGAAIRVVDGNQNTITNHGTLHTTEWFEGTTIAGTGGHDHVNNWGTVVGSIDLGIGTNTFDNKAHALFALGERVNLGSEGLFANGGTLLFGPTDTFQTTTVTGSFTQSGTPRWIVDFGEIGQSDSLAVSGAAQLGNSVTTLDLVEAMVPTGSGRYTLLSAQSGLAGARFRFGTLYGAMPIGQTFDFAHSNTKLEMTLLPSSGPFQWTGQLGGDWTSAFVNGVSNWTRTGGADYVYGTPGAGSDVIFTAPGKTSMGADFVINSLNFSGGGSHALVDTHTLTLVGDGRAGLSVMDSATLGVNLVLGGDQTWWNSGYLLVNGPAVGGNGRHLTVDGSGTTIITSPIHTGAGSLTKAGSGLLVLRGGNTYSGGTTIAGGTLLGDTHSLQGNIVNDAELVFDQSYAGTFAGRISGTGWMIKQNQGALRLSGVNTYSGGTIVSAGTLIGSTLGVQGNILNQALVIFDQEGTGTYSGSMSGSGILVKQGRGALFMTGNSWPFTGVTTVSAGQLFVNGFLGGQSITMLPGTLLGGSGVVTSTTIHGGAVLAPGNSVGVLQVIGDLRLNPGATYRIETEAYGPSDLTLVSGQVFADGATLDIQAIGSRRYRPINVYRMLEANGGLTGTFSNVTTNLAYLDPSVQYNGNTVDFTLRRNDVDFRNAGTRGNQTSVALALNQLVATATGTLASVVNNVYDLADPEALNAMGSMTGLLYQHTARSSLDISRGFANAAMRRLALVERGGEQPLPNIGLGVAAPPAAPSALSDERLGAWFSGLGGVTKYRGSVADPAARVPMRGVIGGFDMAVADTLTFGVSGGRAWPEITVDGHPDRGDAELSHAGLYGRYSNQSTRLDAVVAYSRIHHDSSRLITDGVGALVADSSQRGHGLAMQFEYGRSFSLGRGFTVEPGAGAQIGQMRLDGFTESGGDVLSLVVPARTARSQRALVGGRVGKSLALVAGTRMMIAARAAWAHEFRELEDVRLRFSGDPFANEFSLAAPSNRRDSALVGLSVAAEAGSAFRLFADLGGEVGGPSRVWSGTIGLMKTW